MEGVLRIKKDENWLERYVVLSVSKLTFFEVENKGFITEEYRLADIVNVQIDSDIINISLQNNKCLFLDTDSVNTWYKTLKYFTEEFEHPDSKSINFILSHEFYEDLKITSHKFLSSFDDCGDTFKSLSEQNIEILSAMRRFKDRPEEAIAQLFKEMKQGNKKDSFLAMKDFIENIDFWNEILKMQIEDKNDEKQGNIFTLTKQQSLMDKIQGLTKDEVQNFALQAVEVFENCSNAFTELAEASNILEPLFLELDSETENSFKELENDQMIRDSIAERLSEFLKNRSFWDQLVQMQIENKPLSASEVIPPTEEEEEEEEEEDVLKQTTLWEDLECATMKPAKQLVMDTPDCAEDKGVEQLSNTIEKRADRGPDVRFTFLMVTIAAMSIGLVASSNSVRESPVLFRVLWALAFLINVITVCIPGRLDRMFKDGNHLKPWSSLLEPATWAFTLWGVIYFSELLMTLYVVIIGIPVELFQHSVAYWLAGNWFQALWCFAFRPEFKNSLYLPMTCLLLACVSFGLFHHEITRYSQEKLTSGQCTTQFQQIFIILLRTPVAIHTSWLAAAALLNLNSWAALSKASTGVLISVAFFSVYIAGLFGLVTSLYLRDPALALTVSWALDALAQRTMAKCSHAKTMVPPAVHEALSVTEGIVSLGLKCVAGGMVVAGTIEWAVNFTN